MYENDLKIMMEMRKPIDERCKGCSKVTSDGFCKAFVIPSKRWPDGDVTYDNKCFLSDHIQYEKKKGTFVNPLKASKQAKKGK